MSADETEWTAENSQRLREIAESDKPYADAVAAYLAAIEEIEEGENGDAGR